jgi:isopenicillin-N N-acyltransferase like protein
LKHLRKYLVMGILFLLFWPLPQARGCTLWAAMGSRVAGGGVLIAKNRDMPPDHRQVLRLTRPPEGFRFFGLEADYGAESGVKAGVNEKGLVIVDAAASCIPECRRECRPGVAHLNEKILAACPDVTAVLRRQLMFCAPAYYLVADRSRAVMLEVGLDGTRAVTGITRGILTHTNHYLDLTLCDDNVNTSRGSLVRLDRIRQLLGRHPGPLTLANFVSYSEDRHDGRDNSLWRAGGTPWKIRTLASWIVRLPAAGPPTVYVKLANPGEAPATRTIQLDASFWEKGR